MSAAVDWLSDDAALETVRLQAAAIAAKLGHRIEGWARAKGHMYGLCLDCLEQAVIARTFREKAMSGAAVALRCTKRRPGR